MNYYVLISVLLLLPLYAQKYAQSVHKTIWATFLHKEKKLQEAEQWYRNIIEAPASVYSLKGYILFLADMKNYKKIASYIPRYSTYFTHDATVQATFAQALAQIGKKQESDDLFITLAQQFPTNQEIVFQAVQALVNKKEFDKALSIAQNIINKSTHKQTNFIFHFLQSQLYMQLGQIEKARDAAQQCVEVQPHFFKAWLMIAVTEEQLGNLDKAIQGYKLFLKTSEERNTSIEQHILALALKQTQNKKMQSLYAVSKPSLEKALFLLKQKQYNQALTTINHCIEANPHDPRNKLVKIQILINLNQHDEVISLISSLIKEEPHQQFWFSALHLLVHTKIPVETIKNTFLSLLEQFPQNIWVSLYLADIYLREKAYKDALHHLHQACNVATDAVVKTDLYFQIALIYYETGTFDQMASTLEKGLAEKVTHTPLLNIAAYFYATKGKNIDKAETLISQALKIEPDNHHYLDTRAIILYKQGEYDKAEMLLTGLLNQIENDSTIMLNLAKTKYKLGKIEEAHTLVKRAQTFVHNTHQATTLKKLEQKWNLS